MNQKKLLKSNLKKLDSLEKESEKEFQTLKSKIMKFLSKEEYSQDLEIEDYSDTELKLYWEEYIIIEFQDNYVVTFEFLTDYISRIMDGKGAINKRPVNKDDEKEAQKEFEYYVNLFLKRFPKLLNKLKRHKFVSEIEFSSLDGLYINYYKKRKNNLYIETEKLKKQIKNLDPEALGNKMYNKLYGLIYK